MLKKAARKVVVVISWFLVRLYIRKYKPIIIGVTGSVGKTGTKRSIAHILSSERSVMWQNGNYNDLVTVPLIFFGLEAPSLFNPFAWILTYIKMGISIILGKGADTVVLELGTDGPGQIAQFGKYLTLDIAVVTAISHEHMAFFGTLDAVANEELAVRTYAKKVYIADTIVKDRYVTKEQLEQGIYEVYGSESSSKVRFMVKSDDLQIITSKFELVATPQIIGAHQYAALAIAAEIAATLGISKDSIESAITTLSGMPGRMNKLEGKDNSILIDDSYNASPVAVREALQYFYTLPQKRKIAVLGNMNEMGELSKELHSSLASYCDPKKLTMLITIGTDINKYLPPLLENTGMKVITMDNPYEIGEFLGNMNLTNTAILFKGSQNGVFLEESIKPILSNRNDHKFLVRQSNEWMKKKESQFGRHPV